MSLFSYISVIICANLQTFFRNVLSLHSKMPHSVKFSPRIFSHPLWLLLLMALLSACSATRFLPEDKSLLASVRLKSDEPQVKASDYRLHIRQEANSRWLSTLKVPLGIYCLSGTNENIAINRFMHRIGEAPVVYSDTLMRFSQSSLTAALQSKGYMKASVSVDTLTHRRRTRVTYHLHLGKRSFVHKLHRKFDDEGIRQVVMADSLQSLLYRGMPLDLGILNAERTRIVQHLQNHGYYNINNEFISFTADTLPHSQAIELTLNFRLPPRTDRRLAYQAYRIGKVTLHEDLMEGETPDSTHYRNIHFLTSGPQRVKRRIYYRHLFVQKDSLYRDRATQYSYQNLNGLGTVNYSTIHYVAPQPGDSTIDANVFVQLNKTHGVSFDLEGTNTAGDLGGAATFTYTHRNLFGGAEQLSLRLRGAYEAIRRLEGYSNQDYIEYGAEATLRLPTIPLPLSEDVLRSYKGNTELSVLYNSQNRPEFQRRLLTGTWSVQWNRHRRPNWRNRFDIISLNYVFMPWISSTFRSEYLDGDDPRYAVLRSSYENLFIMRSSYGFTYNSLRERGSNNLYQTNGYQIRANIESAGNLLFGFSKLTGLRRNASGAYAIFGIPYSQYVKFDFDYSKSFRFAEGSSLALHAAFGLAIPYGNSTIIPYEKRYFAGGANSVRGWSVRTLGPGSYVGKDGKIDFINQTGNLKLDLSVEYRGALFWRFEGAAFIDAGNVWNTRDYPNLPSGQIRLNSIHRQIAVAYGLGLRLNLNYFILRFDGGMKAIDPSQPTGRLHYPVLHPNFSRDFALHFAVGLPF